MRRVVRWVMGIVVCAMVFGLIGLELWYRSLLPVRLPEKARRSLPDVVRWALFAELHANEGEQPILFPFFITYFFYPPERLAVSAAVARVHIGDLLTSNELPHERT